MRARRSHTNWRKCAWGSWFLGLLMARYTTSSSLCLCEQQCFIFYYNCYFFVCVCVCVGRGENCMCACITITVFSVLTFVFFSLKEGHQVFIICMLHNVKTTSSEIQRNFSSNCIQKFDTFCPVIEVDHVVCSVSWVQVSLRDLFLFCNYWFFNDFFSVMICLFICIL